MILSSDLRSLRLRGLCRVGTGSGGKEGEEGGEWRAGEETRRDYCRRRGTGIHRRRGALVIWVGWGIPRLLLGVDCTGNSFAICTWALMEPRYLTSFFFMERLNIFFFWKERLNIAWANQTFLMAICVGIKMTNLVAKHAIF